MGVRVRISLPSLARHGCKLGRRLLFATGVEPKLKLRLRSIRVEHEIFAVRSRGFCSEYVTDDADPTRYL